IQRRGGGSHAPAPREARSPAPERSTAAPPRPDAETAAPPPSAPPRRRNGDADGARWPEFLEFVQARRVSLYMTLCHARVVEQTPGKIILGVSGGEFRRELESRETLAQVEALAEGFFGAPTKIGVLSIAEERATQAPPAPSAVETLENPAVRKAVEILGGEVREVRNRR
ncbi:MAG: hypothetical protein ACREQ9_04320, partial [Candidatus Binatia bacterium]